MISIDNTVKKHFPCSHLSLVIVITLWENFGGSNVNLFTEAQMWEVAFVHQCKLPGSVCENDKIYLQNMACAEFVIGEVNSVNWSYVYSNILAYLLLR